MIDSFGYNRPCLLTRRITMQRLLVVEDDKTILKNLRRGLTEVGYEVVTAETAEAAFQYATMESFDGMVLDLMLPDRNGLDLLQDLRNAGFNSPVLILSALTTVNDRIRGLESGGDDYLIKPFAFRELVARLRAQLNREVPGRQAVLKAGDLEIHVTSRKVFRAGRKIDLSKLEYRLLEYLLRRKNQDVSRADIARDVWEEPEGVGTNVIDVYVNALRKKLAGPDLEPLIHTVRGVGYSLRDGDADVNKATGK